MKVLGLGNALVDIVTRIDDDAILEKLNFPKGSMQLVDAATSASIGESLKNFESVMSPGGSAANTIHGLGMMGVETGFLCRTGNDKIGRFFEDSMREVGVVPVVLSSSSPSGIARAIVSPDGERTFATFLGAAAELHADDIKASMFRGYDFCYIEGYLISNRELFAKAISLAKQVKAKVVLDLASYNVVDENRDFLVNLLPYIDIAFANEEEARSLTGMEPEAALDFIASKVDIAVVKIGKKGSLARRGNEKVSVSASNIKAIDTTGAGDMYAAGFIAGLIQNKTLKQCTQYGSILAENIIQVVGAKMDADRWKNIIDELHTVK